MKSALPLNLAKITVVVVFFCFTECAAGNCLSYGHSCWGAHGKRNDLPVKEPRDSAWFLSKLVQLPYDRDLEVAPNQQQLYADAQIEVEPFKGPEDFRSAQEEDFDDIYPNQRPRLHRFKSSKLLDKRSPRMI